MENSSVPRLRATSSSTKRSLQAYTTVASDDIELSHIDGPTMYRQDQATFRQIPPQSAQPRVRILWKTALADVRSFPWGRYALHILLFLMVSGLIVVIALMAVLPKIFAFDRDDFCTPDGAFELSSDPYTPWKRDGAFAINMKFGSYDFGLAKFIDICWDVGVGRGGQALLAFVSYRVSTMALTCIMETSTVPHNTFRAVTLQNNTATGTMILIRNYFRTGGRRAKMAMCWIVLAGMFVLLLPTWLSAMTGYTTDVTSFVRDKDGNLLSASVFRPVVYTIHDGERLGDDHKNDSRFPVPWSATIMQDQLEYGCYSFLCPAVMISNQTGNGPIDFGNKSSRIYSGSVETWSEMSIDCKWMWAISKYGFDYGFLGLTNDLNTTFQQPSETSNETTPRNFNPPLNVSAHLIIPPNLKYYNYTGSPWSNTSWSFCPSGRSWQNPIDGQFTFNVSKPLIWDSGSDTSYVSIEDFNRNGSCQQSSDLKYQWGFSFLLSFTFFATFLVWTTGMCAAYIESWLHSRLHVSRRYMGIERALLDISRSILSTVDEEDIKLLGNHQLQTLAEPNMLTFRDLQIDTQTVTRWTEYKRWWRHEFSFKRWINDEKWWLGAVLFFDVMIVLSWLTPVSSGWWAYASFLPGFGVFQVLLLGKSTRGRWVIFTLWFSLFLIVDCWFVWESWKWSHG